jgi:DNA-binding SARP family transcriptional activator
MGFPEGDQLALLLKVNDILNSTLSVDAIMRDMLEQVITTLKAERGFVVLPQDGQWQAMAKYYLDPSSERPDLRFSRTVVQMVVESGKPWLAIDAVDELGPVASVTFQKIRSVLCAPLRWEGQVQGVVYADHRVASGVFTAEQIPVLAAIADQASRTLQAAVLQAQLQRIHRESMSAQAESRAGARAVEFALAALESELSAPLREAPEMPSEGIAISCFGPFRVTVDGRAIDDWSTRKNRDLLAYLVVHGGQVVSEDKLMDLFWSQGGKKGQHSLHNAITQLRRLLGRRDLIRRRLDGYTFVPDCWIDLAEFVTSAREGRLLARQGRWEDALPLLHRAESLAVAEFLQDYYADWTAPIRQSLSDGLLECRGLLADHFAGHGKHLVAIELWKRVLDCDNCHEEAYRGLMQAYAALGRQADVVRVYQACVKAYEEELDLPPPEDLRALIAI